METSVGAQFENKNKMADSHFAISNQSDIKQLKQNFKNPNIFKATQTWLKFGRIGRQNGKSTRKLKLEDGHEELYKMLQVFYTEIRLLRI